MAKKRSKVNPPRRRLLEKPPAGKTRRAARVERRGVDAGAERARPGIVQTPPTRTRELKVDASGDPAEPHLHEESDAENSSIASQPSDQVPGDATGPASRAPDFFIAGVGASAGGLEALSQLLRSAPADTGMAFILVQHLDPNHSSALPQLLAHCSAMPVELVRDDVPIAPNRVYVVPPNSQMTVVEGRLRLRPRPEDSSQYNPINYFLRSLAEYAQERAVAIILSGTGSDGAAGVRDVKGAGGIVLVQEPESARYDGMPRAAIATGDADLVLTPPQLGSELRRIGAQVMPGAEASLQEIDSDFAQMNRIFAMLRSATGVDFSLYKQPTVRRRLHRRMVVNRINLVEEYVRHLEKNPVELKALYHDILIHVTRFFREPESFAALAEKVYPRLLDDRVEGSPIRIWAPGCSTGEEPYSLAISLTEFLTGRSARAPIQIFATDVSEEVIARARSGIFSDSITNDISAQRLRRFFHKVDGSYRIGRAIRDLCVFARQDLTRDPPFSKIDLIVCRNALIYLQAPLQRRLMAIFHHALKPGGHLMLGSAETVNSQAGLFSVVDKQSQIYARRGTSRPPDRGFHSSVTTDARAEGARPAQAEARKTGDLQTEADRIILSRFGPAGVIVDAEMKIVQFRGQTGAYLEPAPGEASLNLLKMAREGLLHALRMSIDEARRSGKPSRPRSTQVRQDRTFREVTIEVIPLILAGEVRHYLALFHPSFDAKTPPGSKAGKPKPGKLKGADRNSEQRIAQLQQELAASRDYLQSIIQELEAANEELQSVNEEALSSNEELQSTNEELDTAKEELQSTNEEINTVNEELQGRNEELNRVNNDLVNLLGSVEIAIVMVDSGLRIRRFTPMAEKVLNLIPTDVGRPISDIKPNVSVENLPRLIAQSMDEMKVVQRDVKDSGGIWYSLRVRPYKNLENQIDGALIALFDIDNMRRQSAIADAVMETVRQPLAVLDGDLRVKRVNRAFCELFKTTSEAAEGRLLYELGSGQWDIAKLRFLLTEVLPRDEKFEEFRVDYRFPDGSSQTMLVNGRRLIRAVNGEGMILMAMDRE